MSVNAFTIDSRSVIKLDDVVAVAPRIHEGGVMENQQSRIRIELTDDQTRQIKEASGHSVTALDFSVQELEERIAPTSFGVIKPTYTPQSADGH
jgi:hypothetical protein